MHTDVSDLKMQLAEKSFAVFEAISALDTLLWEVFYTEFLSIMETKEIRNRHNKPVNDSEIYPF